MKPIFVTDGLLVWQPSIFYCSAIQTTHQLCTAVLHYMSYYIGSDYIRLRHLSLHFVMPDLWLCFEWRVYVPTILWRRRLQTGMN